MTAQGQRRGKHTPATFSERTSHACRARLRSIDKCRLKFVEAMYTPAGQWCLVLALVNVLLFVILLGLIAVQLFV